MRTGKERFVLPGDGLVVLSFCKGEYRDALAVIQHRYFLLGGSHDFYWLFSRDGRKELGPLGEYDSEADVEKEAREWWGCE